jgi:hypothetical protein
MQAMPNSLIDAESPAALRIDLRDGKYWWSTRLFFLACVAKELYGTRLIIFTQRPDEFVGAVTPTTLCERLLRATGKLRDFERLCSERPVDRYNLGAALGQRCNEWSEVFPIEKEARLKTFVSDRSLRDWLDADLLKKAVEQVGEDLSPAFLKNVMEWAHPYVPVISDRRLKMVVDRNLLTERLATLFIDDLAEAYR